MLISLAAAAMVAFTLLTALLFLPAVYACISFLYRWATLASWSATPGMVLMGIEIRELDGAELDGTTALLHTVGYFISVLTFPLQMISVGMMLLSTRRQGLSDMVLGTVAINRRKPGMT
ncbi:MAG: RDD family protein [Boseongicola sp. SB0673_bin_14]|nr:RDD family protein [Boseongicola sp. SB0667_bin_21]MYI68902.1 RDD family protein [Boseongicola sp. SB0673_bin_14]